MGEEFAQQGVDLGGKKKALPGKGSRCEEKKSWEGLHCEKEPSGSRKKGFESDLGLKKLAQWIESERVFGRCNVPGGFEREAGKRMWRRVVHDGQRKKKPLVVWRWGS